MDATARTEDCSPRFWALINRNIKTQLYVYVQSGLWKMWFLQLQSRFGDKPLKL